jgi:AcrR family transcriptional regulator
VEHNVLVTTGTRERNRAKAMAAVLDAGRRQLAEVGAAALSLRAVARETGMVSSAVYRYVASRDELLTLLIIESYDALGSAVEAAAAAQPRGTARRFVAAATAIRDWAVANPHEYALLYGSPVPGYAAPTATIEHASRTTAQLVDVVVDAASAGTLDPSRAGAQPAALPARLRADIARVRDFALERVEGDRPELSDELIVGLVTAWTQLYGLISFEVFGQFNNVIEDPAALLTTAARAAAATLGLP